MNFPAHLYTVISGQGFGPTQPQNHYAPPLPCSTFEPPNPNERRWGTPRSSRIYLGPQAPAEDWLHGAVAGSLLVLRGGDIRDAHLYGYGVLNLWPLDGVSAVFRVYDRKVHVGDAPVNPAPSPEIAALLVGKALAGAWSEHPRIVAYGPAWALDVLAAIPGAVVYTAKYRGNDKGECIAWGRRWPIDRELSPFQVAQRLSGRSPHAFVDAERTIGSLLLGPYRKKLRVPVTVEGKDHWRLEHAELGSILLHAVRDRFNGEPIVRWPSAEDPWLVELAGDGLAGDGLAVEGEQ